MRITNVIPAFFRFILCGPIHWFYTFVAPIYFVSYAAIAFDWLPEAMTSEDRSPLRGIWLLVFGIFCTFGAISTWIQKATAVQPTEEELRERRERRLAYAQSLLIRRVTVAEVHEMIAEQWELPKSIDSEWCDAEAEVRAAFDEWFSQRISPEDALWFYDTSDELWNNLAGQNGFALVREGKVIDAMGWTMN